MSPTKADKEPLQHWQTWWSISGQKLTDSEILLGPDIAIAQLTDEGFQLAKTDLRRPKPNLKPPNDEFVIHYPPHDEVQSRYRLQINVMARGMDEASQLAQQAADRLLVSMSLVVPDARYFAELRKLRVAGERRETSAWSQTMAARILGGTVPLEENEIQRILTVMATIEKNATAENAYVHLLSAWRLQETSGSKPLQRSVLQHYVLCLESVVNGFMTEVRKANADKIRLRERDFADKFVQDFAKRANKPQAIRDAASQLNKIALTHILPSIESTADSLGVPSAVRDHATELYKFRSKRLSHPGRAADTDLQKWLGSKGPELCLADTVARAFLEKYCARARD